MKLNLNLVVILALLFSALKLTGILHISWLWLLIPVSVLLLVLLAVFIIGMSLGMHLVIKRK